MAQSPTQNPFAQTYGAQFLTGLGSIPASPTISTIQQLETSVISYISTTYYPNSMTPQISSELQATFYNVYNSIRNNLVLSGNAVYDKTQVPFIDLLIGGGFGVLEGTNSLQPNSLVDFIADVEDNVGTSNIPVRSQEPLFLATTFGTNAMNYWSSAIRAGSGNQWIPYFSAQAGSSYNGSRQWTISAMNGALCGYGETRLGELDPVTNFISNRQIAALLGALAGTLGSMIFNWTPRIVKPMRLNTSMVANLNNNPGGPTGGQGMAINKGNWGNVLNRFDDGGAQDNATHMDSCGW